MTASGTWDRLVRFRSTAGEILLGQPIDASLDIGEAIEQGEDVEVNVVDTLEPWAAAKVTDRKEKVAELLSPLSMEQCGMIRAIGLNYKDHAEELGMALPDVPTVFIKPPHTLANPNAVVHVPKVAQDDQLDYEVELAIVLGRDAKDVSEDTAMEYVLGYTCANDLTGRKHQKSSSQWVFCKGFDQFCPLGPCLVSARKLAEAANLKLTTTVNGDVLQDGNTNKMIFSIPKIIAHLSQGTTLPRGTVIITGTPPGIGESRTPPVFLRHGHVVKCSIGGGIGTLVNHIQYD